jgi:hypothetical protein
MIVDPAQQGRNACGGAANLIGSHHAPVIVYCASGRLLLRAATGNCGSARLQRLVALRLNRKPTFCPKCLPLTLVARAEPQHKLTVVDRHSSVSMRKPTMSNRQVLLYFAWSRPAETGAPLAVIDDRFPAVFELRRLF